MTEATTATSRQRSHPIPALDRSRDRLRLPVDLLPELLRQASGEGAPNDEATERLETGGVVVGDVLDPLAERMLGVIARASLMVAIDVQRAGDSSVTTIWATPHQAVVTSSVRSDEVDVEPVRMTGLASRIADVILLGPPVLVDRPPLAISTLVISEVDRRRGRPDDVRRVLGRAGFGDDVADLLLAFGAPATRRWRISSTWATESGPRIATLRGLDAAESGQWLVEVDGHRNRPGVMRFTPQGDGQVLGALRSVLPRSWVGRALNPPKSAR